MKWLFKAFPVYHSKLHTLRLPELWPNSVRTPSVLSFTHPVFNWPVLLAFEAIVPDLTPVRVGTVAADRMVDLALLNIRTSHDIRMLIIFVHQISLILLGCLVGWSSRSNMILSVVRLITRQ